MRIPISNIASPCPPPEGDKGGGVIQYTVKLTPLEMTSLTGLIRHFKLALMGRQPWDKDLIIFLALKGRHIILIQRHCPSRGGKVPSPLAGEGLGEGYFRINTILGESMPNIETDTPDIFSRIMSEKKS